MRKRLKYFFFKASQTIKAKKKKKEKNGNIIFLYRSGLSHIYATCFFVVYILPKMGDDDDDDFAHFFFCHFLVKFFAFFFFFFFLFLVFFFLLLNIFIIFYFFFSNCISGFTCPNTRRASSYRPRHHPTYRLNSRVRISLDFIFLFCFYVLFCFV